MAKKKSSNSGVDGAGGYEFQKHCALYIFLEQYNDIKDTKYFIFLEHHEDFLFCYLNEEDLIKSVDTYQAKKSSKKWTITNKEFEEILMKILQIGLDLKDDTALKTDTYSHKLHFVSNREIALAKDIINERNKIRLIAEDFRERIKGLPLEIFSDKLSNAITPLKIITDKKEKDTLTKMYFHGITARALEEFSKKSLKIFTSFFVIRSIFDLSTLSIK